MPFAVNGKTFDGGDIRLSFDTYKVTSHLGSVNYGYGMEAEKPRGGGIDYAAEMPEGVYATDDVEFELMEAKWRMFKDHLGPGYLLKRFGGVTNYHNKGDKPGKTEFRDLKIKHVGGTHQTGSGVLMRTIQLYCTKIIEDDVDPLAGAPEV